MTKASFFVLLVSSFVQAACGAEGAAVVQCGDELACGPGEVCVEVRTWSSEFRCVENPCGTTEPSCECAASLCEESPGAVCGSVEDHHVSCVCPTC